MKATEQYFPVVLFIMLYNVVQAFESVHEILKCDHSNERCFIIDFFVLNSHETRETPSEALRRVFEISGGHQDDYSASCGSCCAWSVQE